MALAQEEVPMPKKTGLTIKLRCPGMGNFVKGLEEQDKRKAVARTASGHGHDPHVGESGAADDWENIADDMARYGAPPVGGTLMVKLRVPGEVLLKLGQGTPLSASTPVVQRPSPSISTTSKRKTRNRREKQSKYHEAVKRLKLGSDSQSSSADEQPNAFSGNPPPDSFGYAVDSPPAKHSGPIPPSDYDDEDTEKSSSSPSHPTSPTRPERAAAQPEYPAALPLSLSHLDPNIASVHAMMVAEPTTHTSLPSLYESVISSSTAVIHPNKASGGIPVESEKEIPWTAENLFHLYILSYHHAYSHIKISSKQARSKASSVSEKSIQICDLIVDTWIRAFQRLDDDRRSHNHPGIWRKNVYSWFSEQKRKFADCDYPSDDINLVTGATVFQPHLLRLLYAHTAPNCGARLVWGDALALRGKALEREMEKRGFDEMDWPQGLVLDVLRPSLRMVRERLTLKIEERDPAEWCARYHEHGNRGNQVMCYRDVAAEEEEAKKAAAEEQEESEEDGSVQMMDIDTPTPDARRKRQKVVAFVQNV